MSDPPITLNIYFDSDEFHDNGAEKVLVGANNAKINISVWMKIFYSLKCVPQLFLAYWSAIFGCISPLLDTTRVWNNMLH